MQICQRAALTASILAVALAGCTIFVQPLPTSVPLPQPTLTAPAPIETTAAPEQPTPDGPLPSVWAETDLGLLAGNAYRPAALAITGETAYVLCQNVGAPDAETAGIAVVDLAVGEMRAIWPLPGKSSGPLAAGGGKLYTSYQGTDGGDRLAVLNAQSGQTTSDLDLSAVGYQRGLWLDVDRSRLYLALASGVEVRDAGTLAVIGGLRYPFEALDRRIVCDLPSDRLYLALSNALLAYRASDLSQLWQVETTAERIADLIVDADGQMLAAVGTSASDQPSAQVLLYTAEGRLRGQFGVSRQTGLAWASAATGRIVCAEMDYAVPTAPQLRLWSVDLTGQPTGQALRYRQSQAIAAARGNTLYLLGGHSHELVTVDAAGLAIVQRTALGIELSDLVVDHDRQRLYINDTASRVYQIDLADLPRQKMAVQRSIVAGAGELTLSAPGNLLLTAQTDGDNSRVSVVDVEAWNVTQVITGGDQVALDQRRGRALVGAATGMLPAADGQTQVWDLARRERVGAIAQGGEPVYNSLRDEVVVAGYTAHVYDAETLAHKETLTADIDAQQCKGCTGQPAVMGAQVFTELNLLALPMATSSAGKGPGILPSPRLFALDTLAPVSHTATLLETCRGEWLAMAPISDTVIENLAYSRYFFRANAVVRKVGQDKAVAWRDGLAIELLSPDGQLAFVARDGAWLALNTANWTPVGYTPRHCIHSYDRELGVYWAIEGARLTALSPRGSQPIASGSQAVERVGAVRAVIASPDYAHDRTLFAADLGGVHRSRDGGATWEPVRGGLPALEYPGENANLTVVASPDYAHDHTLFAGGWDSSGQGLGVWRSTDDGETWRPMWNGLMYLCVQRIAISENYAATGELAAYCRYDDLSTQQAGNAVFLSRDRGERWVLTGQANEVSSFALPEPNALFGSPAPIALRAAPNSRALEVGQGGDWRPILALAEGDYWVAQAFSPRYDQDRTLYGLTALNLYRSTDNGQTWQRAASSVLSDRRSERRFTALDVTLDADGAPILILGDYSGRVEATRAADLEWQPMEALPAATK